MNDSTLIKWLNWFYTLEVAQVDLYLSQAKKSSNPYITNVLLKTSEIEAGHAEMFNNFLDRLNHKPYKIDSLISYIAGHIPGLITPAAGKANMLLYNYTLETIAIADYKKLLKKIKPEKKYHRDLIKLLISNLIDEDLHRTWFKDQRFKILNL